MLFSLVGEPDVKQLGEGGQLVLLSKWALVTLFLEGMLKRGSDLLCQTKQNINHVLQHVRVP